MPTVNTSCAFDRTHIERILAAGITRMRTLALSINFAVRLLALQSLHLCFAQDDALFCGFFLQPRQELLEICQTMTLPDGTDTGWRNKDAPLAQIIAGSCLATCRILCSKLHNRFFRYLIHTVFELGFAAADIEERFNPARALRSLIKVKGIT